MTLRPAATDKSSVLSLARGRWWRTRTRVGPLLGASRRALPLLSAIAVLAGVSEAALLVLVVRLAVAVTAGHSTVELAVGPLGPVTAQLWQLFTAAFGLTLLRLACGGVEAFLTARISSRALAGIQKDVLQKYFDAEWSVQAEERTGQLQDLLITHVQRASLAVLAMVAGLAASLNLGALLVSAFVIDALAAVALLAIVISMSGLLIPITKQIRGHSRIQSEVSLESASGITEATAMAQEVRVFASAKPVQLRLAKSIDAFAQAFRRTRFYQRLAPELYQNVAIMFVLGAMLALSLLGPANVTELGAVLLILVRSVSYGNAVQSAYQQVQSLLPFIEQIQARSALYAGAAVCSGDRRLGAVDLLEFRDVCFEYRPGEPVLAGVSFRVQRGETIGIVGPSGAGKSTFVQLLLRLRQPTSGRYLVNGEEAESFALEEWFQRFSLVPQEPRLFSGTVADNIRFFRDDLADEQVERASRLAHLHEDVIKWPRGYETPVGERSGGELSGGQRQRLVLARTLAGTPDVIVLDEPTSALDMRSEALVQETLRQFEGRVTTFIVAHRLSTLHTCDRIMVFEGGRLVGFDLPTKLLASNRFFGDVTRLSGLA